jgi:hypothetical protein
MSQITARSSLRLQHTWLPDSPSAGATMHQDWFAEAHREGAAVVVSVNAPDPQRALEELLASDDPLDYMFKDFVRSLTGFEVATLFSAA